MKATVARKMSVPASGEVTVPVEMGDANAVSVVVAIFVGDLASVVLQGSSDLENWVVLDSAMSDADLAEGVYYLPRVAGSFSKPVLGVATRYVRLRFEASSKAVVAADIVASSL